MQTTSFNLNLLKTFEALFHCRSVTRAARELGISPSTVSQHLASLREAYGDPLFVPVDREMVPTTAAEELFPSIADALGACARVIPTERKHARAVLIAMSDDFEFVLGRAIADAFKKRLPEATPIIRQTNALLAERSILSRETHFAVTGGGTHANTVAREAFGFHWDCCLFEAQDDDEKRKDLTLEEYVERSHIVVHYGGPYGVADGYLRRLGLERSVDAMTSHYGLIAPYLLGTDRVALVPVYVAEVLMRRHPSLTCCDIPFPTSQDPVELSYRYDLIEERLMQRAAELLREILSRFDWDEKPSELRARLQKTERI